MRKINILLLFFVSLSLTAQNLDSLYNTYVNMKTGSVGNPKLKGILSNIGQKQKCAFSIASEIKLNINRFSPDQKIVLQKLLSRPSTDTSIVSPSGYFRIHFSKVNIPDYIPEDVRSNLSAEQLPLYKKLYLDSLALAADSAYNYEVNILKYNQPPSDGTAGGDDKYDIYLQSIPGYYGETVDEEQVGQYLYTSYIFMDNSFAGYYTKRIDAARVTLAHEFHHAIQIGSYSFKKISGDNILDLFYHELTSTSMEEFVFNEVNDYYSYVTYFMNHPDRSFNSFTNRNYDGYDLAIWNLFLTSQFDVDIIRRTWELMKQERAMNAIADAIAERGSSFREQFAKFGLWLYFTGSRALPGKYFNEAANYPLVKPFITSTFNKPETSFNISSEPLSTNILLLTDYSGNQVDSFVAVISNCDMSSGSTTDFKYTLSSQSSSGFTEILDGYYSKIESDDISRFTESNIFNNNSVDSGTVHTEEITYAFPQPFKYSQSNFIYFPIAVGQTGNADLYIYSVDMDLIYSGMHRILAFNKTVVQWKCADNYGNKLGSGVYLYIVKSGDKIKKGKFVIIND